MTESYDLDRFVAAQDPVFGKVLTELAEGRKQSHWMWFVFPQIQGLGHSPMARRFAISSAGEAAAYLAHPILGPRLLQCARLVNGVEGKSAHAIFGSPDDFKFRSSMTLFSRVPGADPAFGQALDKYFGGGADPLTLERM